MSFRVRSVLVVAPWLGLKAPFLNGSPVCSHLTKRNKTSPNEWTGLKLNFTNLRQLRTPFCSNELKECKMKISLIRRVNYLASLCVEEHDRSSVDWAFSTSCEAIGTRLHRRCEICIAHFYASWAEVFTGVHS